MKFLSKHHNFLHLNKEVILYVTSFISRSIRHGMILKSVCISMMYENVSLSIRIFAIKSERKGRGVTKKVVAQAS